MSPVPKGLVVVVLVGGVLDLEMSNSDGMGGELGYVIVLRVVVVARETTLPFSLPLPSASSSS